MAYNLEHIDPDQRTGLYVDPGEDEAAAPAPRRVFRIAGALLVMGLFAGGLCFAYMAGLRHAGGTGEGSDIPLIRADTRPVKVKPDDPGGMHIADRNMLIYGDKRPSVEHLLPPPEQPMLLPAVPALSPGTCSPDTQRRCHRPLLQQAPPAPARGVGRAIYPPAKFVPSCGIVSNRPTPVRSPASPGGVRLAQLGAQRGSSARGMGAHQAQQPGFAGPPDGGGDSRRPRRQRRLLPYQGRAGRRHRDRLVACR